MSGTSVNRANAIAVGAANYARAAAGGKVSLSARKCVNEHLRSAGLPKLSAAEAAQLGLEQPLTEAILRREWEANGPDGHGRRPETEFGDYSAFRAYRRAEHAGCATVCGSKRST